MRVQFSTVKNERNAGGPPFVLRVEPMDGRYSVHGPGTWQYWGDVIKVAWSTGFSGLTMQLSSARDTLTGTASTFWDFPRPTQTARVRGSPIPCE
jgi:hypothetical protein